MIFEARSRFHFSSNFDGIFFIKFLSMRTFKTFPPIFFYPICFRDTRGPKGQKCNFWSHIKVLFFIRIRWDFFSLDSSEWELPELFADFFYLLPFLIYKGPKRKKTWFLRPHQIFIFHPILMGLFHWIPLNKSFQNC